MPKRVRPEFYWIESKQLYRKRVKCKDGGWHDAYGRTKEICRQRAKELEKIYSSSNYVPASGLQVHEYAAKWFKLNTAGMKAGTRDRYRTNINVHICPAIGAMELAAVKPDDIRLMLLSCSSLARDTQKKVLIAARKIFRSAVENDLIPKNPCDGIKVTGAPPKKREALTDQQRSRLVQAVKNTRAETFVLLCLDAGLRRSEALGLCWDSVYLDGDVPYIDVKRSLNYDSDGKPELVDHGKSDAAARKIPIPPELVDHLKAKRSGRKDGPVVHDQHGKPCSKQSFRRLWDAVRAREEHEATVWEDGKKTRRQLRVGEKVPKHNVTVQLDFHPTPHMLRHTYITKLILSGANIKTVQYLAGHASVQLTLDIYTHLMASRPEDTQAAVLVAFGGTGFGVPDEKTVENVDK